MPQCRMMCVMRTLVLLMSAAAALAQQPNAYKLKATPKTVVWGYYSASAAPVLRVHSGDTVRMESVSTGSPARFEAVGVPHDQIPESFRAIYKEVTDKGPGGHI